jgi:hypothetical protein
MKNYNIFNKNNNIKMETRKTKNAINSKLFINEALNSPVLLLSLICCLGLFVRVLTINHPFWLDELSTAWVVRDTLSEIFTRCWINNLSPLYYTLVYISKYYAGYSEASLRIPSVVAGVLTIPLFYLLTYKLSHSKKLSLFAAFLSSIDLNLIHYSLEVRPYSLVIFFSMLQIYFFLCFLQNKQKIIYSIVSGLLSGIVILFHYTSSLLYAMELLFAAIYLFQTRNFSKEKITGILMFLFIPLIVSAPVLSHLKYLFVSRNILESFIPPKDIYSIFSLHPHLMQYIIIPFSFAILVENSIRKKGITNKYNANNFSFFFLSFWYFFPLLILWALSEMSIVNLCIPRYITWIIPAPVIGCALLVSIFRSNWSKFVFTGTLFLLFIQSFNEHAILRRLTSRLTQKDTVKTVLNNRDDWKSSNGFDWKEAVTAINNSGAKVSKIYLISGLAETKMLKTQYSSLLKNYLLSPVNSMYKLNKPYIDSTEPISSVDDIQDSASNYILVGDSKFLEKFDKKVIEMSPKNAVIRIFYVPNTTQQLDNQTP